MVVGGGAVAPGVGCSPGVPGRTGSPIAARNAFAIALPAAGSYLRISAMAPS